MLTFILLNVLLTGVLLYLIAMAIPGLEIHGLGPALGAAVVMALASSVIAFALTPVISPYMIAGGWLSAAVNCANTVLVLAIATTAMPGIRVSRGLVVVVAGVLLEASHHVAGHAIAYARQTGLLQVFT